MRRTSTSGLPGNLLRAILFIQATLALESCKKTVVSDKVTPIVTQAPELETPRKGIGNGIADTQATIILNGTKCSAERVTEFEVKVLGIKDTSWTKFKCTDKSKEILIDAKTGYCNVLQLRAHVSMDKPGFEEKYIRETAKVVDKQYFIVDQTISENSIEKGINIHFEDINDEYWSKTYKPCLDKIKAESDTVLDIIEGDQKTCAEILGQVPEKDPAVDWNDFEFSVMSDQVKFSVEGFPDVGCNPN